MKNACAHNKQQPIYSDTRLHACFSGDNISEILCKVKSLEMEPGFTALATKVAKPSFGLGRDIFLNLVEIRKFPSEISSLSISICVMMGKVLA
jgi:hypothetical protein